MPNRKYILPARLRNAATACLLAVTLLLAGCASSKKNVRTDAGQEGRTTGVLGDVTSRYTPWTETELSGKLHAEGSPLSPSLKVYMKRGERLVLSARAPFVGEVVRLDLSNDSLFAVNKLKKVYCRESAERLQEVYPTICSELQSFLLGRIVVPGQGELSAGNIENVTIGIEDEMRRITPKLDLPIDALEFYYLVDPEGRLDSMVVNGENGKPFLTLDYDWKQNGAVDITATTSKKGKPFVVELDFDAPRTDGKAPSPFRLGGGYRQVGIKDFIKSF